MILHRRCCQQHAKKRDLTTYTPAALRSEVTASVWTWQIWLWDRPWGRSWHRLRRRRRGHIRRLAWTRLQARVTGRSLRFVFHTTCVWRWLCSMCQRCNEICGLKQAGRHESRGELTDETCRAAVANVERRPGIWRNGLIHDVRWSPWGWRAKESAPFVRRNSEAEPDTRLEICSRRCKRLLISARTRPMAG